MGLRDRLTAERGQDVFDSAVSKKQPDRVRSFRKQEHLGGVTMISLICLFDLYRDGLTVLRDDGQVKFVLAMDVNSFACHDVSFLIDGIPACSSHPHVLDPSVACPD